MTLTYNSFVPRILDVTKNMKSDINASIVVPYVIDYAEQRIYRDLDLLATRLVDSSTNVTANQRTFTIPSSNGTFLVVETVNVSTPSSVAFASGKRNPLTPVTKQFLDIAYPSSESADIPLFYAMQTNSQITFGPIPDDSYPIEITGTYRPNPLSSSNPTTILTTMLPDLFVSAALVGLGEYLINHGLAPPQNMERWEAEYKVLMQSALVEEFRKKYQSQAWTDAAPSPVATPPRV